MAHHNIRADPDLSEHGVHGHPERKQGWLSVSGLSQQLRQRRFGFSENDISQRHLEMEVKSGADPVEGLGKDSVVLVEPVAHGGVLGALAG
ncbi:hypothetical protein MSIMFB_03228 [Mycobacterium simulans]|uniref:Uncharacterized protein n=1 Tax=Mycobacterium simulans TaxID=627089 RepID=A0A7Z7ILF3_9MYCO|nr:hypothetical protein MSIMFB_03228 [Mycobacterium simulans]